jgi:hypothetical protein
VAIPGSIQVSAYPGLIVLLVDPEKCAQLRERLRKPIHLNVDFDTDGTKIVIYQPDEIRASDYTTAGQGLLRDDRHVYISPAQS